MENRFLIFFSLLFLSSCSVFRQTEPPPSTIKITSINEDCEFPKVSSLLEPNEVSTSLVQDTTLCLEKKIDSAFDSLRGKNKNELSIEEIRTLVNNKILTLPFRLKKNEEWDAFGAILTFFNPEGRPAISKATLDQLVTWMKKYQELYVRSVRHFGTEKRTSFEQVIELIDALENLFELVSPKGRFTLSQALMINKVLKNQSPRDEHSKTTTQKEIKVSDQIEALWKLKSLILEDTQNEGASGSITGQGLKKLFKLGFEFGRNAQTTINWTYQGALPQHVPSRLPEEWKKLSKIVRSYFIHTRLVHIDTDQLRWTISKLAPKTGLSDLAPDLVRMMQRLAPDGHHYFGLHSVGVVGLIQQVEHIAREIVTSAPAFGNCLHYHSCEISLRDAFKTHLKKIALKGDYDNPRAVPKRFPYSEGDSNLKSDNSLKRLDTPLTWQTAIVRWIELGMITQIFKTFDSHQTGRIALEGANSSETKDAMDLAYTFLRFAGASQKEKETNTSVELEEVVKPIIVKPSALYKIIGLIGDKWMHDGDNDGFLNADEFFSVVKIYQHIQSIASRSTWAMWNLPHFTDMPPEKYFNNYDYSNIIFSRTQFIQNLHKGYEWPLPQMFDALMGMTEKTRLSLFHALIGVPDTPIQVYQYNPYISSEESNGFSHPATTTLRQYARTDSALAPAAVITMIDRLMIKCDQNEDGYLDWFELDCAMPLLLEAGFQTVSSELVDLDPIVHDGSKVLLDTLKSKGIPLSLSKLLAINGTIQEDRLSDDLIAKIEPNIEASWKDLALFIGGPTEKLGDNSAFKLWELEAIMKYGHCDKNKDGKLTGNELDCFVDIVLQQTIEIISQLNSHSLNQSILQGISSQVLKLPLIKLGIKLSTQPESKIHELINTFPKLKVDFTSSPSKILKILEESIRRSVPLCQLPDC